MPLTKQSGYLVLIELARASPVYPKPKMNTWLSVPSVDVILEVPNAVFRTTNEWMHGKSIRNRRFNVKRPEMFAMRSIFAINLLYGSCSPCILSR